MVFFTNIEDNNYVQHDIFHNNNNNIMDKDNVYGQSNFYKYCSLLPK